MITRTDVTGLILAGGYSRRFGREKAWHLVQGKPMIAHVLDAVSTVVDDIQISVRSLQQATRFERYGSCVVDLYPNHGPLAGIHAGWQQTTTDWLLVVGCDMPFLTSDALRLLLDVAGTTTDAVVGQDADGRLHPLCACYHRRTLPVVTERLAQRQLALTDVLASFQTVRTVCLPSGVLRNINRMRDLP